MTARRIATVILGVGGGYLGIATTGYHWDIAWSAFNGIRAPAEPGLGVSRTIWGLSPWLAGAGVWLRVSRGKQPTYRWLAGFAAVAVVGFVSFVLAAAESII